MSVSVKSKNESRSFERDVSGNVLTQDRYDELEEECSSYGEFELTEG